MKECHCVIACAVSEREREAQREEAELKEGGKERYTRQLLCPRALPRNVTQHREQLPGLRRPEGQGWHQRAHILYTVMNLNTHTCTYTGTSLLPFGQLQKRAHYTWLIPFSFCHVCFGGFAVCQNKHSQGIYGGKEDLRFWWKGN